MKTAGLSAAGLCLAAGTLALAHQGVTNPVILERMGSMTRMQESAEILGEMAKGERPFDAAAARAAARAIAREADRTPDLFAPRRTDPNSEALPAIWEAFDTFEAHASDLATAARSADGEIDTRADLGPALAGIGGACRACHEDFRE